MTNEEEVDDFTSKVFDVMERYAQTVDDGLQERWSLLREKVELYDSETYEVAIGLVARQATLTIHLAVNPGMWTGHIAPLVLRAMTDAHITLAWILQDPPARARQYILHGLGQEKLLIAHLEADADGAGELRDQVDFMLDRRKAWLESQRRDFLTEVSVGSWSGLNVRDMATEANCDGLYRFAYTPFSSTVHSMWNHVSTYNLRQCTNPLHKFHRVPVIAPVPLDPDYVYRSAKYVSRSFESLDAAFSLAPTVELPVSWLGSELSKIAQRDSADTG